MIKVEILDGGIEGKIEGNISIGSRPSEFDKDRFPLLEWKLFDESTRNIIKLTNNVFYDCIRALSKDDNK